MLIMFLLARRFIACDWRSQLLVLVLEIAGFYRFNALGLGTIDDTREQQSASQNSTTPLFCRVSYVGSTIVLRLNLQFVP